MEQLAAPLDGQLEWLIPPQKEEVELMTCTFLLGDAIISVSHFPRMINRWLGQDGNQGRDDVLISLPLAENYFTRIEGRNLRFGRSDGAVVLPMACAMESTSKAGGEGIDLFMNRSRLEATARLILGTDRSISLSLEETLRFLPEQQNNVDHSLAIESLVMLVAAHSQVPGNLSLLGIEDILYRQVALLCFGHLQSASPARRPPASDQAIHLLCERLRCQLEGSITLSIMQELSGLSARSLQYGFNRLFGVSAMQWVREQRLYLARDRLAQPTPDTTVASVAYGLGFSSHSAFSQFYLKLFKELPSATLARGHSRRGVSLIQPSTSETAG